MVATISYTDTTFVEAVTSADPLRYDTVLKRVIDANTVGDIGELVRILKWLYGNAMTRQDSEVPLIVASVRDLGMVMGSLRRFGIQPVTACPGLEPLLVTWAEAHHMVPRDTVHHYTTWNPRGPRRRMYTGNEMERHLIASVCLALPGLADAISDCVSLSATRLDSVMASVQLNSVTAAVHRLVDAIDQVVANVTGEFFATRLRPFFEPVNLNGRDYLGPAAAHVPVAIVDLCLWASDAACDEYSEFWRTSAEYGLPGWASISEGFESADSVVTRILPLIEDSPNPVVISCAESLGRALKILLEFRAKHLVIAKQAYDESVRSYEVGSGGGTIELLHEIVDLTRQQREAVKSMAQRGSGQKIVTR